MQLAGDPFCSVVFDIQRLTRARVLPLPVCAVSPDGLSGLHVSFGRQEYAAPGRNLLTMQGGGGGGGEGQRLTISRMFDGTVVTWVRPDALVCVLGV